MVTSILYCPLMVVVWASCLHVFGCWCQYLFNGDFVDRGGYGVEITISLFLFALLDPGSVVLNRGNHEERSQNEIGVREYGLEAFAPPSPLPPPPFFGACRWCM